MGLQLGLGGRADHLPAAARLPLGAGLGARSLLERVHERHEVGGHVLVGVVGHPVGQVVAPVEPLGPEVVEADALAGAAGHGQQGGDPGEELEVDDRLDAALAAPAPEPDHALGHVHQAGVGEAEDVLLVEEPQQAQRRGVLLEDDEARRLAAEAARALDRGGRQDRAAHLRELDEQNATWIARLASRREAVHEPRPCAREEAQGTPDEGVDAAHGGEVHRRRGAY